MNFFTAEGAGPISKALLRTGQIYFLYACPSHLLPSYHINLSPVLYLTSSPAALLWIGSLVIEFSNGSGSIGTNSYEIVACGAVLTLTNSLTCRVFRIVRLLKTDEMSIEVDISTIRFRPFVLEEASPA